MLSGMDVSGTGCPFSRPQDAQFCCLFKDDSLCTGPSPQWCLYRGLLHWISLSVWEIVLTPGQLGLLTDGGYLSDEVPCLFLFTHFSYWEFYHCHNVMS